MCSERHPIDPHAKLFVRESKQCVRQTLPFHSEAKLTIWKQTFPFGSKSYHSEAKTRKKSQSATLHINLTFLDHPRLESNSPNKYRMYFVMWSERHSIDFHSKLFIRESKQCVRQTCQSYETVSEYPRGGNVL